MCDDPDVGITSKPENFYMEDSPDELICAYQFKCNSINDVENCIIRRLKILSR